MLKEQKKVKKKKNNEAKKRCVYCQREFLKKNLEKHILNQHTRVHINVNSDAKKYIIENGIVKFID